MTYTPGLKSEIIITSAGQLSGTLSSTIEYIIDGTVDMAGVSIQVPATGLSIRGLGFGVSNLISSENSFSLFTDNGVDESGDLLLDSFAISITGTGSQVFDLDNQGNFGAVESNAVNFNDCTSLGTLSNYRQGLENNTGRFGGTPTLTLSGTWVGGYRCTTSIVRSLSSGMTTPLFKEGASFTMASRFLTDINCDLPASAAFCDFQSSNFTNPSTLQSSGAIYSRDGVIDSSDSNIFSDILSSDISSIWKNNQGISNTYVGGGISITTETATAITSSGTYFTLAGTFTASDLQHFDMPSNGQLRHLGDNPIEYKVSGNVNLNGGSNDEVSLRIRKFDAATTTFEDIYTQNQQVNNLSGGRDIAFFPITTTTTLNENDYLYIQVANITDTTNVTGELGGNLFIEER